MKPEYIGVGNFDEDNYVYAYCKCPISFDYAIKWPRIKDGQPHTYSCICEDCGTKVGVVSKSYGPEVYKSEDVISRRAAIDAFEKFIHELGIKDEPYNYGEMALSVQNVPPVTPAEKTGHWIARGLVDSNDNRIYECSECHHSDTQAATMIVPYCWYCGAKMQEAKK